MLTRLREPQELAPFNFLVAAVIVLGGTALVFVMWGNPITPWILIVAAAAASVCLILLQRPLPAFYVALFIRLLPIGFLPPLSTVYTMAMNLAVDVALGAWLLDSAMRRPIRWHPVCILVAIYMIWSSATLLWAPDIAAGATKLVQFTTGLGLLFLASNQLNSLKAVDGLMHVIGLIGWMLIACASYMLFTDFNWGQRLSILSPCETTPLWVCAVLNPNQFGGVVILMSAGVIWPALRSSGLRRKIHMALSMVFLFWALILTALTGSRGGAISFIIVLLAFCFSKPLRPWGILGLVLLVGLLGTAPFVLDTLVTRIAEGEREGGDFGGRDVLWEASLLMLRDVAWTGAGIGNGPIVMPNYVFALTSHYNQHVELPSHNPFLEAGVDTGLFGMLLYASIGLCAAWQFLVRRARSRTRDPSVGDLSSLVLIAALGYLASWIKSGGMGNHPTFFVLLMLLLLPSQLARGSELGAKSPSGKGPLSTPESCDSLSYTRQ
jgi:O-antigen ligase